MKSAARLGIAFGMALLAMPVVDETTTRTGHATVFLAGGAVAQSLSPDEVFSRAQSLIADHMGVDRSAVTPETDIIMDLGADDLDVIELVMAMEEEFDVVISDDQMESIVTVADMLAAVGANGGR